MKVGVYAGHFGVAGGGENHSLAMINILKKFYDVTVMVDQHNMHWLPEVQRLTGWNLDEVKVVPLDVPAIRYFDQFININHGLMLPPIARRNMLLVFYPQYIWDTRNYDTIITNSEFTKQQIIQRWGRRDEDIHVIHPPIDLNAFQYIEHKKKKQILTIGRFFEVPDGNNKNHDVMINAFRDIPDRDVTFNIVGSVQNEEYFQRVKALADLDPRIKIHHNLSQDDLIKMYSESSILWHAAGYGTDIPSSMEHFGMSSIEAIASGCLPIVHNSGGMPESGALTWETPKQLISLTRDYLDEPEAITKMVRQMYSKIEEEFDEQAMEEAFIDVIEKPIALFRPIASDEFQRPHVVLEPDPTEITIGIIGDAPNLTTGFGLVEKMYGRGFIKAGFKVTQIGVQDGNVEPHMEDEWRVWRPGHQGTSADLFKRWIEKDKPTVLWLNYDAGNIAAWLNLLASIKCDIPVVAYFPIEGFPIPKGFVEMAKLIAKPVTYLKWGADLMREQGSQTMSHVPHGLDHANFRRFSEEERQKLKDDVGWGNKFIIGFFGRNKRTKQQPRIIETVRMLKEQGIKDIILYMHTQVFEGHMMNGWALDQIVEYNDMGDTVCFPSNFSQVGGIDYDTPSEITEEMAMHIDFANDPDADKKTRQMILESYSMVERYNMCDLFISVSQAEGFNLPLGEAMACGVPVICVDDAGSQREVVGEAAILIPPIEWDTWHIGTLLPIVSKKTLANEIAKVMASKELRAQLSDASLAQAAKYKWEECSRDMNRIVIETFMKTRS